MAAVITLSDSSDDSDDLPSFADRVKQLMKADVKKSNRNASPKQILSRFHPISDSDDSDASRETVPFSTSRNVSPDHRSTDVPKCDFKSNDDMNLDEEVPNLNHRNVSPFTVDVQSWDLNQNNGNEKSDDDLSNLNHRHASLLHNLKNVPEFNSNVKDDSISSSDDNDISLKKIVKDHKEKRGNNDFQKEMKKKIRLENQNLRKKAKDLTKALKATQKEVLKNQKPEECLKNMKIALDHRILYLEGSQSALNLLDQNNLEYSIEENTIKYSVNWYRKIINVAIENREIVREEREELADTLVIMICNGDFLKMVHSYVQTSKGRSCDNISLAEFIVNIQSLYLNYNITCVTVGYQNYLRNIKEENNLELKAIAKQVHKNATEEAIAELQLQASVNFNFLDNMSEFGSLLQRFTKAIAGAPQRQEEHIKKSQAFSWYAEIDSHCPIKLTKDGSSFIKLWQQQIQQFQNVGPEVAEAIVSRYPSPRLLLKAYKRCITTHDAENLLQDIVVRRNYGPLGTQKRIGPELSFKFYLFFTSRDGNKLLKR